MGKARAINLGGGGEKDGLQGVFGYKERKLALTSFAAVEKGHKHNGQCLQFSFGF